MEAVTISLDDIQTHVVQFGLDVLPVPEVGTQRTRLNMFYEAARDRFPQLYDQISAGDAEFKIFKTFRKPGAHAGPSATSETFVLTNRGPVFVFPLRMPDPINETGLQPEHVELFREVLALFREGLPGTTLLHLGVVRELIFSTGASLPMSLITRKATFAGADLAGADCRLLFQDARMNHRIGLNSIQIMKGIQHPVGATFEQRLGFGLRVVLDVNNKEIKPMAQPDIDEVIDRAVALWPAQLLEYLTSSAGSSPC